MTALLLLGLLAAAPVDLNVTPVDGAVTAGAAAAWGGLALLGPTLAPAHCRWCDRDANGGDSLNAFDRLGTLAIWTNRHAAEVASNVLIGAIPVGVFAGEWALAAPEGTRQQLGEDLLLVAEVGAVQGVLNQGLKSVFARERPYAHLGLESEWTPDSDVSFYSGHASTAFALVAAGAEVAALRGYPHAWVLWAAGLPLAATVAYLRVAAGKHYLTDVLVGAAVGTVMGVGLPLLFHPGAAKADAFVSAQTASRPVFFSFGGRF